jgi:ABC-2 type transport system ATP-binding protein
VTAPTAAMIEARDLTKHFGALTAVERLSFSCSRGEIFGFVGPDGAGKTTIMRVLSGTMPPDGGSLVLDGVDVLAEPERAKAHLSYMPQRFGLYEDLTVDENIDFFAELFEIDRRTRDERAARLLAASGMQPFRRRLAGALSGGMKQKLGLTCALIHAPKVLLLDEPTAGVDPVSRRDFWRILHELRTQGVTIVISTSYLDEAERCARLGLLHAGRMVHCDTPAALKALMPGQSLRITTGQARAARDAVTGQAGVISVLIVGDGLNVVVDDGERRRPELERALAAAQVPVERIEPMATSMDDLFIALIERPEAPS